MQLKSRRWLLGGAVLAAMLVVAVGIGLSVIDWQPMVERMASERLGRPVSMSRLGVELGWSTKISVAGLRVAEQPPSDDALLEVDAIELTIKPFSIVWGPLEIPQLMVAGVDAQLARDAEGRGNWAMNSPDEHLDETAPQSRGELPRLGKMVVDDAGFVFEDASSGLEIEGRIDVLSASSDEFDGIRLRLTGVLDERPLNMTVSGAAVQGLSDRAQPYPIDLQLFFGDASIEASGGLLEPLALKGVDMDVRVTAPSASDLFPLIPATLPETPPFDMSGRLRSRGDAWSLGNLKVLIGDSDFDGQVSVVSGDERPKLSGELHSRRLDIDQLTAGIGEEPNPQNAENTDRAPAGAEGSRLFPDTRIPSESLGLADAELTYVAEIVATSVLPLTSIDIKLGLKEERLVAELRSVSLADGKVRGELALNARDQIPSADVDLVFDQLDLGTFFADTEFADTMKGEFNGRFYLLGIGARIAELVASVRGDGRLTIRDSALSGQLIELIGLDVIEALGLTFGDDVPVALRCGVLEFAAERGVLTIERALADTTDSVLLSQGQIDLGAESLAITVEARSKDFSLLDVPAPVSLSGAIRKPEIGIGEVEGFPIELGDQKDLDCDTLLSPKNESKPTDAS